MPRASEALEAYLHRVYGPVVRDRRLSEGWDWSGKDVLHWHHAPAAVRVSGCTPPLGNASISSIAQQLAEPRFYAIDCGSSWTRCLQNTGLLWRFDVQEAARVCRGEGTHHGGYHAGGARIGGENGTHSTARWETPREIREIPREIRETPREIPEMPASRSEMLGWVEVSHVQNYRRHDHDERGKLWMDSARGSGLWYWRGRSLTILDLHNCGEQACTQATSSRLWERARVHGTLIIDHRVADDGQVRPSHRHQCTPGHVSMPFYKVEIVGLNPAACDANTSAHITDHITAECSNLARVLHPTLSLPEVNRRGFPPVGTECLWHAWRGRLRWGWPADLAQPPAEPPGAGPGGQGPGARDDPRCAACVQRKVQTLYDGSRWRLNCDWEGSRK